MPKPKSILVIDIYNTIHQVGMQIDTLPQLMLTTAVMAWRKILLLRRLYCILLRWRWGELQIKRRGGQWTVWQSRLLTVLGLHETVSTEWWASRCLNTDYSQSYSWSGHAGILFSCGSCCGNLGNCETQSNHGSRGSRGSRGHQKSRRSCMSLGSCRSRRNREGQSTCGSRTNKGS